MSRQASCFVATVLLVLWCVVPGCGDGGKTNGDEDTPDTAWNPFDQGSDHGNGDTADDVATDAADAADVPCLNPCGKECCSDAQVCLGGQTCCTPTCDDKCQGGTDGCGTLCAVVPDCNGCCTPDRVCKPGTFNDFCGQGGLACQECTGALTCQNHLCSNSACEPSCDGKCVGAGNGCGGICTANGCDGCCQQQATGPVCMPGDSQALCGKEGGECQECTSGKACVAGVCGCTADCSGKCMGASDGCGSTCASNDCDGCCTTDKVCQPGTQTTACGKPGGTCKACGQEMLCTDGECTDKPCEKQCSGRSCGDDGCGGSCGTCTSGQVCTTQGQCCTPVCTGKCPNASDECGGTCSGNDACAGCCSEDGMCQAGTTWNNCGIGGEACDACVAPEQCTNHKCKEPCDPVCDGKCPGASDGCDGVCTEVSPCTGCCDVNGFCQPGTSPVACGKEAGDCVVCMSGEQCLNQSCGTVCTPNCTNKCPDAPDGCGGTCTENAACSGCCSNGFCMPGTWTDLCGNSGQECLTCVTPQTCVNQACVTTCVADCTLKCSGESDGCGGVCPTCGTGYSCVSGVCEADSTGTCAATIATKPTPASAALILLAVLALALARRARL